MDTDYMHQIGLCNHQRNTFFYDWHWQLPRRLQLYSLPGLSSTNGWGNFSSPHQHCVYRSTGTASNHNSIILRAGRTELVKITQQFRTIFLLNYGTLEVDAVERYCRRAYNGIEEIMPLLPSPVKLMDNILVIVAMAAASSCC